MANSHLTKNKILKILKQIKGEIKEKYKVKEIGVFGSFVRNEQRKRSDIDILVEFEKVPDLLTFINMENYLSKIFRKKVDLVRKNAIRKELKKIVLNEVVYA